MSKKPKRPRDTNQLAKFITDAATGSFALPENTPLSDAQISGSKGGKIGGKARADSLTSERKKEIAKRAAKVRWGENEDT